MLWPRRRVAHSEQPSPARLPNGLRLYAIGDIHGELGLLRRLLQRLEEDSARRPPIRQRLVILGDFIDHGAQSAQLLRLLHAHARNRRLVVLKGNHEAALIDTVAGSALAARLWFAKGGNATLAGFGVDTGRIAPDDGQAIIAAARRSVPPAIVDWLDDLPVRLRVGDYFFVHAGVRPGVALWRQKRHDLLWIGREFVESPHHHGAVVVHGHHRCADGPVILDNRIGMDVDAHRTRRLAAVGLERRERWVIDTGANERPIESSGQPAGAAAAGTIGP